MGPPDNGAKEEGRKDRHILLLEQIDNHRGAVRDLRREEGTDNDHGPDLHSNDLEGANDDGIHHRHDEGCIHGLEEGHDGCCSIHRWMDNPRDDKVATETDDGNRSEGFRFAPNFGNFSKVLFPPPLKCGTGEED